VGELREQLRLGAVQQAKTSPKYFNDYKSEFDKICYNSSLSQQTFS